MAFFRKNYKTCSDEELMTLLTKREQQAFDELYNRYSKLMLNFFYRMLYFDKEKAEDMLHDLFLKIIEKPHLFDAEKKFSTWIYRVAGNMLKNEFRDIQIHTGHEKAYGVEQETMVKNAQMVDRKLFLKIETYWIQEQSTVLTKDETNFGIGVALGYKFLTKNDWVGDVSLGAGRIFGHTNFGAYPRFGISIGKRF